MQDSKFQQCTWQAAAAWVAAASCFANSHLSPHTAPRYSGTGVSDASVSAGRAEPADKNDSDNLKTNLLAARYADAGQGS
jgi:hypothetical protein